MVLRAAGAALALPSAARFGAALAAAAPGWPGPAATGKQLRMKARARNATCLERRWAARRRPAPRDAATYSHQLVGGRETALATRAGTARCWPPPATAWACGTRAGRRPTSCPKTGIFLCTPLPTRWRWGYDGLAAQKAPRFSAGPGGANSQILQRSRAAPGRLGPLAR